MSMFKRLDHVTILTDDVDAAGEAWERNLGLKEERRLERPAGRDIVLSLLPIGDAFLELLQPLGSADAYQQELQEKGEGMSAIAIEVEDLDSALDQLRQSGAKVSDPDAVSPNIRMARVSPGSTHGVTIRLIERR